MPEWSGDGLGQTVDRDRLILDHLPLLRHISGRMCFDSAGSVEREDLYGFGMIGLIAAAESWESSRGLKFSTYAYPRIRGAILDELRRLDFLPRGRRERLRELEATVATYEQQHGYPPNPEELAEAMRTTEQEIDEILLSASSAVQTSLEGGPSEAFAALLTDPRSEDPIGSAEWKEMRELLVDSITDLPEREKTVITLYYGEDLMLKDISEVLGVTESRVSQIHSRALYRLNRTLGALIGSPD
ncbi:MAG: RNA polymerase sigma factor for flagellar operon FliA [Planctomycetota bacterium]|jgi:RNA polymerase sigma factor for flagellar operon FliA